MDASRTEPTPESSRAPIERPNGPVVGAVLAAGVGVFILGLLTTIAAASESFAESLQYDDGVGPLSGKTLWGSAAFFAAWGILGYLLRDRELPWKPVLTVSAVLVGLGLLGTFPTFFQAFTPE